MQYHLQIIKNFIMKSINEPDKIIDDDIHYISGKCKMTITKNCMNGYMVVYQEINLPLYVVDVAKQIFDAYEKSPITIFNKILHRPENIIILGYQGALPIYFKKCVFKCDEIYKSINICEDCLFVGDK